MSMHLCELLFAQTSVRRDSRVLHRRGDGRPRILGIALISQVGVVAVKAAARGAE